MRDEEAADEPEQSGPTLAEDLRRLAQDARAWAGAELAYQKARAVYAASEARGIACLVLAAAAFLFFAVTALVVGTVIALAPLLTPWGAMLAVTFGLLLLAALCLVAVSLRIRRMKAVLTEEEA